MTEADSRSWLTGSAVLARLRDAIEALSECTEASRSGTAYRAVVSAVATSKLAGIGSILERWIRSAWLYQWLTAEPEADVVVIDLRDSLALGPLFVALDGLASVSSWLENASAWRLLRAAGHDLAARPIRAASLLVLVAAGTETTLSMVVGGLTSAGFGLRLLVLAFALAGTRIRHSPAELRESRVYDLFAQLLVPPEPVEQRESEGNQSAESRDDHER